jgi:hypothetical protein
MECPHCHEEIPGIECPHCGAPIPPESNFCMICGADLKVEPGVANDEDNGYDPDDRILCPDGTCTGIIVDGKCSECGKPYKDAGQ